MSFGTLHHVALVRTNVSEEHVEDGGDMCGTVQEAFFAVHHEAYPCYELERFKSIITLKMEATCSSEMSVLTRVTWHKVPKDIYN
jgi:hypothetical protein